MSYIKIHNNGRKLQNQHILDTRGRSGKERLHERRRRVRLFAVTLGSICGLIAVLVLAWASHQPQFQIAKIVVEGNRAVESTELVAHANTFFQNKRFELFSSSNILLFSRSAVERHIAEMFPRVAHVTTKIQSFDKSIVALVVSERVPYARFCGTSGCYFLDEQGFIFAHEDESAVVRDEIFEKGIVHEDQDLVGRYFLPNHFATVVETTKLLEREGVNVVRVSVLNEQDFRLELAQGVVLFARFDDDPSLISENFGLALQTEELTEGIKGVEYIDLRFKNRVYYKK